MEGDIANCDEPIQKSAKQLKNEAKKKEKLEKFKQKQEKLQQQQDKEKSEKKKKETKEKDILIYDKPTPPGEKKDVSGTMPNSYSPKYVEAQWYSWWEKSGFFKPEYGGRDINVADADKFVMVIPPPNVTGSLHLGHALTCTIEDILTRWNRMRRKVTIWNPGCDHAGIATQVVVEKRLWKEQQKTRHDLGREGFLSEVWKWKAEKGNRIYDQIKLLGCSVDWDRATFTMDPKTSKAVTEAFVRLHDEGLIYRCKSLVNWSCTLKSAISDIEVDKLDLPGRTYLTVPGYEKKVEFGVLHIFAYEVENSDEKILVATTRIETMLGDTAIAVNPKDTRYTSFHGKYVTHPFLDRRMPIICDDYVDIEFGTGAVKITPAHDMNDCEIGKRHSLSFINIMNEDGTLNEECGQFSGMKRFEARTAVLVALSKKKLYRKSQDNAMTIPICNRSKDIIEPLLKVQWYLNVSNMAEQAVQAVEDGELNIHPKMHVSTWNFWLKNIRHWCISRQLWWGHRIPAYFITINDPTITISEVDENTFWVSGRSHKEALEKAAARFNIPEEKITLKQEDDVLDTWFSSGLFPLAVFGWPDDTPDFRAFYPGTFLETGYDIIFFWVARMVMLGLQLTGQLPFKEIFLHTIIRDAHGRKMSKSLGNVIDPISVINGMSLEDLHETLKTSNLDATEIEKAKAGQKADFPNGVPECGTDALRFALCNYANPYHDVNLDIQRIVGYRHFCNKLWNGVKFSLNALGPDFKPKEKFALTGRESAVDLWILSRLVGAINVCNDGFEKYEFTSVAQACHGLWMNDICSTYIESLKPVLNGNNEIAKAVSREILYACLDVVLRLLSPMMPFVTEELYQRLPRRTASSPPSLCVTPYPTIEEFPCKNEDLESDVNLVISLIHKIRSIKADYKIPNNVKLDLYLQCAGSRASTVMSLLIDFISCLSQSNPPKLVTNDDEVPPGCVFTTIPEFCIAHLMMKDNMDVGKEMQRLTQEEQQLSSELEKLLENISSEDYQQQVPEAVKAKDLEKVFSIRTELGKVTDFMKRLDNLSLS